MEEIASTLERLEKRNSSHLKSYDHSKAKQKQENYAIELRKKIRQNFFNKKRTLEPITPDSSLSSELKAYIDQNYNFCDSYQEKIYILFELITDDNLSLQSKNYCFSLCSKHLNEIESIVFFLNSSYLPIFLSYLKSESMPTLLQTTHILANLTYADSENCEILLDNDIIPLTLWIIENYTGNIQKNCLWALANLCVGSPRAQNTLISLGFFKKVIQSIKNDDNYNDKCYVLLAYMMKQITDIKMTDQALDLIHKALCDRNKDKEIIIACLFSIFHITKEDMNWVDKVLEYKGMAANIVYYANMEDNDIVFKAIRVIGNLVSYRNSHTQYMMEYGILDVIYKLIDYKAKRKIREEALFALSNVVGGDASQIREVFKREGLLEKAMSGIVDCDAAVRREAWQVFSLISRFKNKDFTLKLIEKGILQQAMVSVSIEIEQKNILIALSFFENCLIAGAIGDYNTVVPLFHEHQIFEYILNLNSSNIQDFLPIRKRIIDNFYKYIQ
ncbi:hypothetical protein SteCoe_28459 [Stentor coeruleus]|uniref:Importin subunit alpha n=1 Tax=Stentor coeruleus TaxID=5963 RepID=A0A1R2B8H3_9CILI|nr:hypothetical protein SteCoe_28459 [Stentor coeruleus]